MRTSPKHLVPQSPTATGPDVADGGASLARGLEAICREVTGREGDLRDLRRLSGGASQDTFAFDYAADGATHEFVLRRAPDGAETPEGRPGLATEAQLMQLAGAAGVPSPPVRLVLEPRHGLGRGFLMDRVPGETIARKLLRDPEYAALRPTLPRRFGEILARIHDIPAEAAPGLRHSGPRERLQDLEATYRSGGVHRPVFELAFVWLARNAPAPVEPRIVHGDLRNGNMIIDASGVRAVLDWELAHLGDPAEDLGWICVNSWRFGEIDKPVGGFGSREDLFEGYAAVSGRRPDPARVRYWEILGTLSWGVGCSVAMPARAGAGERVLERAMIARRASECEIDLLRLLTGEA